MALVKCISCGCDMPDRLFQPGQAARCSLCKRPITARLLPSLYKSASTPPPLFESPPEPGEAVCFYNPNRRATKMCDHCGVFISDSWAAQWGRQTVCLRCLEELRSKHKDSRFEAKRVLGDNIALFAAIGPFVFAGICLMTVIGYAFSLMFLMLTLLTAPAALFLSLRYWNSPRSLVPRGRGRLITALLLSILQILGWVGITIFTITAIRSGS